MPCGLWSMQVKKNGKYEIDLQFGMFKASVEELLEALHQLTAFL